MENVTNQENEIIDASAEVVEAVEAPVEAPVEDKVAEAVEAGDEIERTTGFQKRIDRFNRRLAEKDAEIERLQRLAPPAPPVTTDKPTLDQFTDVGAYAEAVAEWKVQQALAQVEATAAQRKVAETYQGRVAEFMKSHADFDEVLQDVAHLPVAPEIHEVILDSDVGPALAYHLASNPDVMAKINALPKHRRYTELGKLEDKLTAPAPVKKTTQAPAPVKSEKGSAPVQKKIDDPNLTQAEYRALRMKQMGRRR